MPSLGPAEILVILVVALLVFGPEKMPEIARQVGKGMREFKRVQQHLRSELRDVVAEFDAPSGSDAPEVDTLPVLPPKAGAVWDPGPEAGPDPGPGLVVPPAPAVEQAPVPQSPVEQAPVEQAPEERVNGNGNAAPSPPAAPAEPGPATPGTPAEPA